MRQLPVGVLVINGAACSGTTIISGTVTVSNSEQYVTGTSGVLVLDGSTGGNAYWGATLASATGSPILSGSWDGAMSVSFSGSAPGTASLPWVAFPEVLVYYPNPTPDATMQGFDGNYYDPICNSFLNGSYVQAYNGIPNPYIFNFGDGLPCYRYSAGPNPVAINTQGGWPSSGVMVFPQTI